MKVTEQIKDFQKKNASEQIEFIKKDYGPFGRRNRGLKDLKSLYYLHFNNRSFEFSVQQLEVGGGTVLDIGCGEGTFLKEICSSEKISCVGVDLKPPEFNSPTQNPKFVEGDVLSYKTYKKLLKLGPFDLINSTYVFRYLLDPFRALKRIYNLLKPLGEAYIEGIPVNCTINNPSILQKYLIQEYGFEIAEDVVPSGFDSQPIMILWHLHFKKRKKPLRLPLKKGSIIEYTCDHCKQYYQYYQVNLLS